MRKLFATILLAASLGGCQGFGQLAQFATVGVDNPITVQQLAEVEQSYLAVLRPVVAYLETRTCRKTEDELTSWGTANRCAQYARKIVVQDALRQAQKYRRQLSAFVKQNRTVDAGIAFAEFSKVIGTMKTVPNAGAQ
jgi:hypothetical protein